MFVAATEDELSMCSGHVDAFGALLTMRVREPLDVRPRPPLTQPVTPTLPSTIPIPTPNVPHPTAHPDIGTAARVACARPSRARRRTRRGLYHRVHRRRNNVHPIHDDPVVRPSGPTRHIVAPLGRAVERIARVAKPSTRPSGGRQWMGRCVSLMQTAWSASRWMGRNESMMQRVIGWGGDTHTDAHVHGAHRVARSVVVVRRLVRGGADWERMEGALRGAMAEWAPPRGPYGPL
jgi:hypothetical protein